MVLPTPNPAAFELRLSKNIVRKIKI